MPFTKEPPRWESAGAQPPEEKLTSGWSPSEKVPAPWLNWYFNGVYEVLKEMKEKGVTAEELKTALDSINVEVIDSVTSTDKTKAPSADALRRGLEARASNADLMPNLLVNSSGLMGLEGWTQSKNTTASGEWSTTVDTVNGGYFWNNSAVTSGNLALDSDIIPSPSGGGTYHLQATFLSKETGAGVLGVQIIDATTGSFVEGLYKDPYNTEWHRKEMTFTLPSGISRIRVRLINQETTTTEWKCITRIKLTRTNKDNPYSLEGDIRGLFQSVSDGKGKLETTITGKGGTVSKVGSVATFDELNNGVSSIIAPGETFGGGTADFNSTGASSLAVPFSGGLRQPVVLKYKNFTLNEGHTITTSAPGNGLVIYVEGDAVINGAIDMSGKAHGLGMGVPPLVILGSIPGFNSLITSLPNIENYRGGAGGNGGAGGMGNRDDSTYSSGGAGGTGSNGRYCAGGYGGGGGGAGAAFTWYSHASNKKGGNGSSPDLSLGYLMVQTASKYTTKGYADSIISLDGTAAPVGTGGGGSGGMSQGGSSRWGEAGYGGTCTGAGGGGGGGIASYSGYGNNGGGGGYAGGCIVLIVRGNLTIGATGSLKAAGGNGGYGGAGGTEDTSSSSGGGGGGGGGGGAGGGVVAIFHKGNFVNNGSVNVSGGSGGAGGAAKGSYATVGTAGQSGAAGSIVVNKL